jgi:hypothetical protein
MKSCLRNFTSHPEIYKPFGIVILISVIQQLSGASILRAYVVTIFETVFHPSQPVFGQSSLSANDSLRNTSLTTVSDPCAEVLKTSHKAYAAAILIAVVRLVAALSSSR